MKKQTKTNQCLSAINAFGGATMTTDPFEKWVLLILRTGKMEDHLLLTKMQSEELIPLAYESESMGIGRVKYYFKPIADVVTP